ncbi:RdgB/HAM1 family non-canonical purine NTP pyrophosphatase [Campylobacter sp. VicNov18]|uniref:RdgB/HAM1 family non-canonical purine NTP pyrophosphatase n=1 Tax=Campylobacter bilis TaxID=2691918 RepID=UPI00130ED86E|nr:RdgB/HAM1 family non-canonical purine NTP pyrophosphatase [Campylobacter bilis]MPV64101.1 RdgB/HAM1 family non-canonical purine NTP pyrophosphatase [Campylobacter hepaticus]MBM0637604.1 RdgB/HAM1 family non-canonical purine NTP pyrophosphatase [Campylobacter bilis]MCC8278330.1 RdgB/HAM1 family non-canonical purine NTP pyrophosphatase [Campylobacter bilis]MCC8299833.1 RdgB/HAM1 family non-canonical purine NTP pyrophosphatase [Campylobacter bilis]MCC8301239.1 RdgB/HAM1 family non-canonical pu
MKIILATSNKHKVEEIKSILKDFEIYAFDEVLRPFEIEEKGNSFKENALIKARAVFNALSQDQKKDFIVLSDDSGICVDVLGLKPGIYSARFSIKGDDQSNRNKLIEEMAKKGYKQSKAHYVAAIALVGLMGELSMHGTMHGHVINTQRGQNGFGYDAIFIPKGFNETLAQLSTEQKNNISHRFKALKLAKILLKVLKKQNNTRF